MRMNDRSLRARQARRRTHGEDHRGTLRHHVRGRASGDLLAQVLVLAFEASHVFEPFEDELDRLGSPRLQEDVAGAVVQRLDGRFDRVLRGDGDHRHLRIARLHSTDEFDPVE